MHQKLSVQDGRRIWRHFQRFAEYNDFKLLYNKIMPEMAKIEHKMIDFTHDLKQTKSTIRRVDEALNHKIDKISID